MKIFFYNLWGWLGTILKNLQGECRYQFEKINNLKSHQSFKPFNTIPLTLKPKTEMTRFVYFKVESKFLADRIRSISCDWKSSIKKENSLKFITLSMAVNRITGSKELANLLHKYGHRIFYTDTRHVNKSWSNE